MEIIKVIYLGYNKNQNKIIDNYKIEKNIYGTEEGKRDSPKEDKELHTTDKGCSNDEEKSDEQNGESNKKVVRRKVRIIKRKKKDESQ